MGKTCYCKACQLDVKPKKFSTLTFIFLLFIGILPGIYYLLAYYGKKCPLCGRKL